MSPDNPLPEFDLINRFFTRTTDDKGVVLGVGDDAAVLSAEPGTELVVATDVIVEQIHFPAYTPPHAVGHRALAVNLSDLAAMGAEPRWATLALSLPEADPAWVEQFATGFFALADAHNIALVGGDTVAGPLFASVTVHGVVPAGEAVLRSTASDGDGIYVTGCTGDAVAGRLCEGTNDNDHYLAARFLYPAPRVAQGRALRGVASAMIDVSDGLHADLTHMLSASGVGAELDINALPLSAELIASAGEREAATFALTGGDDYELCFTVPPEQEPALQSLSDSFDCPLTRIGTCTEDRAVNWREDGKLFAVPAGYSHFETEGAD